MPLRKVYCSISTVIKKLSPLVATGRFLVYIEIKVNLAYEATTKQTAIRKPKQQNPSDAQGSCVARFFSGVVKSWCRISGAVIEFLAKPVETSVTLPLMEYAASC